MIDSKESENPLLKFIRLPNQSAACCNQVSVDPERISFLLKNIPQNPEFCFQELVDISNKQKFSVSCEELSLIITVLSEAAPPMKILIYKLLLSFDYNDTSILEFVSNATCLSLFWKDFPDIYSAKILTQLVDKNPSIIAYFLAQTNEQQMRAFMSINNPNTNIESVLLFFSHAFSKVDSYNPIMNDFVGFICQIIQSSDDDDLIFDAKEALSKMIENFQEVAESFVPLLPLICIFQDDSTLNGNTVEVLTSMVKKLQTNRILLQDQIMQFILNCFDISPTINDDFALFSVLNLLKVVEDVSPFDGFLPLFEKLAYVLKNFAKYELIENSTLIICRMIKYGLPQHIEAYLKLVNFDFIFEFAGHDNIPLQKAILEATIKIHASTVKETRDGDDFLNSFFNDDSKLSIIDNLTQSENSDVANLARAIYENVIATTSV